MWKDNSCFVQFFITLTSLQTRVFFVCLFSVYSVRFLWSTSRSSDSCEWACSWLVTSRRSYLWAAVTRPVPSIRDEQVSWPHLFIQPGPNDVWVERAQLGAQWLSSILLKRVSEGPAGYEPQLDLDCAHVRSFIGPENHIHNGSWAFIVPVQQLYSECF